MPLIPVEKLTRFVEAILTAVGIPARKAAITSASLVGANLRGVDSHGILLVPRYVDKIRAGEIDVNADGVVLSESGACLLFDGQNGVGQWISEQCCDHAVRLAKSGGVGMVVARDSNHFGAAAWWAQKIRDHGMIGLVFCNASPLVPPWQGKQGRIGTNPICMAAPGPWLLDMATTTVAANRIFKEVVNGREQVPAGWALDANGVPTTSSAEAARGMLMPLGGYKGSGLGMMVEILCAVLAGSAMANEVGGIRVAGKPSRTSQTFIAIDIARFMPVAEFTARLEKLVGMIKSTPPASGYEEVLVAGEPEWRREAERRVHGIPVEEGNWKELCETGGALGVAPEA
ncbi:MAG TPA: Ldh family oxidoreductase [Bryobacteraceae bacterium]|jgi:LDH2 family malate/lactate/ureidoglycolate dehydrogenase|nr:Ldh family oxidoreductase [Bryobacteraceae bacterium]